jgi:hypothetical protein
VLWLFTVYPELPSLTVYPWVSRFSRWPPGLTVGLENLTDSHKNTISENIVCSFERKSVRVCKVGNKKAKKPKSPQFVVQIKVVVQYSRKNWAKSANYCSEKFFLTPKMVHWPKIFWRRGVGSPILICSEKNFFGSGRAQSENYELKAPTTSRFLIIWTWQLWYICHHTLRLKMSIDSCQSLN